MRYLDLPAVTPVAQMPSCNHRVMPVQRKLEILRLHSEGWSYGEIARAIGGTSRASIHRNLVRWGIVGKSLPRAPYVSSTWSPSRFEKDAIQGSRKLLLACLDYFERHHWREA